MSSKEGEHLLDAFVYDESSPTFLRWKVDRYAGKNYNRKIVSAGDVAGVATGNRVQVRYKGIFYIGPRVVWYLHFGEIPDGYVVDHIDGNIANNCILNLRAVTEAINRQNSSARSDNKSGVCGVREVIDKKGREHWMAFWKEGGKSKSRWFSKDKYGDDQAKSFAIDVRNSKIAKLNLDGECQYTERHGK